MGIITDIQAKLEKEKDVDFVNYKKQYIVSVEQEKQWKEENEVKRKAEKEQEEKLFLKFKMVDKRKRNKFLKEYEKLCKKHELIVVNVDGCVCNKNDFTFKNIDSDYIFTVDDEYCEFFKIELN